LNKTQKALLREGLESCLRPIIIDFRKESDMSDEGTDAQIATGDAGQQAEDMANNLIGEQSPAEAVYFYGLYSLAMGGGFVLLWVLMNSNSFVFMYKDGFLSRIAFYLSAGIAWLMVSFFDGEYMRSIYTDIQALSVMGPFFFHWYAFGMYMMAVLDGAGDLMDWIFLGVWFFETVFEQVFQIILLPKVFDWADSAEILENDTAFEEDSNLARALVN